MERQDRSIVWKGMDYYGGGVQWKWPDPGEGPFFNDGKDLANNEAYSTCMFGVVTFHLENPFRLASQRGPLSAGKLSEP